MMASIIPGFEYDIFISYRHNDNRSGWVTDFVNALQEELAATIKEPISIYFDKNLHDGLLETHNVDKSLEGKLKCLVFIPIISQTYCDTKSFAWQHEFCAFNKLSKEDQFGRDIKLSNGNVASRILPIKIHELDSEDKSVIERELAGILRAIEFIFKSAGVNRPLRAIEEHPHDNLNKTFYRDQINKVANAIKEIIGAIKNPTSIKHETGNGQPATVPSSKRKVMIGIAALLFITIGYFGYRQLSTNNQQPSLDKSIAVLPFVNMSNDPEQEYFSDGITEEILNTFVKIKDLKVAGRTSSFQYKGKNKDLKTIGKELGVTYIIEGSVRKTNDEVRITAQLINAESGFHVWSEEYTGSLTEVFNLQERVSVDIARNLSEKLGVSELTAIKHKNVNANAFEYYLKGRQLFMKRENLKEARQLLRMAIRSDSSFDQAYSSLAVALTVINPEDNSLELVNNRKEGWKYAGKAQMMDSMNAEAYLVMGMLSDFEKKWEQSRLYFDKALRLNPSSSTSNLWFGQHLFRMGHFAEAHHYIEKATSIEPFYGINYIWLSSVASYSGDFVEAISAAREATAMGNEYGPWVLAGIYLETGQAEKIENVISKDKEFVDWIRALKNKDKVGLETTARNTKRDLAAFEYYWMGFNEDTMRSILKHGDVWEAIAKDRKVLRKMPGFKEAVVKFGFLDYWKKYGGPDICPDISQSNFVCD